MTGSTHVRTFATPAGIEPTMRVSRTCACGAGSRQGECEACASASRSLQRRSAGAAPGSVPPIVSEVLGGQGRPLDVETRAYMEPRFGSDFSRVRIHDDPRARESARAIKAAAYTVGSNIVVDAPHHESQTESGRQLLAHELAHVAQQGDVSVSGAKGLVIDESPAREMEADAAADAIGRGYRPASAAVARNPVGGVQRQSHGGAGTTGEAAGGATSASDCFEAVVGEAPASLAEPGTVTIVEFSASWCNPCHMLQASLEDMCRGYRRQPPSVPVHMFTVDIEAPGNERIAEQYAPGGVPHLYVFAGTEQTEHLASGPQPDVLEQIVNNAINEASKSGARRGAETGMKWGWKAGLGAGLLGALAIGLGGNLEGNALMGALVGSVVGGTAVGLGLGAGIGAIAGHLGDDRGRRRARRRPRPQPKLRGGLLDDPEEREADATAERVTRAWSASNSRQSADTTQSTGGAPLDAALRNEMESRFSRDFSGVRVHRDGPAHRVTAAMNAYAVTHGSDIYFAPDGYAPDTLHGRVVLAHELTHVVQQGVAAPRAAASSLETEAVRASADVARGDRANVQHGATSEAPLALTRAKKTLLWSALGLAGGAAAGALVGLGAAALSSDISAGSAAGIGALIGGGAGLIGGFFGGLFIRRTDRVGAQEADMLIRRRYGQYLPGGVPSPLRNAIVHAVSNSEMHAKFICRHGQDEPDLLGFTDTGAPWAGAQPPAQTIDSPEDEPMCADGTRLEHATPERPVIYYPNDSPDAGILVHEGLHAMAHPEFQRLHVFVTEGTTEMYTRRLLSDVNIEVYAGGHGEKVPEVEKFETIIGEEPLARAYFAGAIPELDRATTALLGPCALQHWAFALQMMSPATAESVLVGRNVDYCDRSESLSSAAPAPGAPGTGETGGHRG